MSCLRCDVTLNVMLLIMKPYDTDRHVIPCVLAATKDDIRVVLQIGEVELEKGLSTCPIKVSWLSGKPSPSTVHQSASHTADAAPVPTPPPQVSWCLLFA